MRTHSALAPALLLTLALAPSCASLEFQRDTQSSGTFQSSAWSFTILTWDFPQLAMETARENASDANLPSMRVTKSFEAPSLGWFDWLLDLLSIRYAKIWGTWGYDGE